MSLVGDFIEGIDRHSKKYKTSHAVASTPAGPPTTEVNREPTAAHAQQPAPTKTRGEKGSKGAKHKARGRERGYTHLAQLERDRQEFRNEQEKKQKQLLQQKKQLSMQCQRAEAETKRLRSEAAATLLRGQCCEEWANRLVGIHGEDGEILPATARARALQDLMDHTYGKGSLESRRVVTAVEAQKWSSSNTNPLVRGLSALPANTHVWYLRDGEKPVPATIVAVESDLDYEIQFSCGSQRHTMRSKLVPY